MSSVKEELENAAACVDCGVPYEEMGSDITLPNNQWEALCPENIEIILCGSCIARRAASLPGSIAIRACIDFASEL